MAELPAAWVGAAAVPSIAATITALLRNLLVVSVMVLPFRLSIECAV
jgi:hypothetical protein